MPLTKLQSYILRLIASHRSPESYVAGSTPLNRDAFRSSDDIDVFHDREEAVAKAALQDVSTLQEAGLRTSWLRQEPALYAAEIKDNNETTRLEWVADSEFRFFPTMKDDVFGYILHPVDLAANKMMAAAGRRKATDIVDLVTIHDEILPVGALACAAVEKAPGFTPEGLLAEIRRNSLYTIEELKNVPTVEPINPRRFYSKLFQILDEAEAFVVRVPSEKIGLLFLKDGKVVQPDPDHLDDYQTHAGRRKGHWPSSSNIMSAMLERYKKLPKP